MSEESDTDYIDIPVKQQEFSFTYVIGEDKENGSTTTTQ
tara:strand:- start:1148 stop:1264 length:117 start_codon:yes stop_codon:yes gene_type:complete